MDFTLDSDEQLVRDTAAQFARDHIAPVAAALSAEKRFPADIFTAMGPLGFLGVKTPAAYGGAGMGSIAYSLVVTEIARACASTAVGLMVTNLCGDAINAYGTPEQKAQYLPKLTGAVYPGGFSLSEPGSGSDAAGLKTTAIKKGGKYVLNGQKAWSTNGDRAGVFVVMALTDRAAGAKGISAFLVEQGTPGFTVGKPEKKMGQHASTTVALAFDDCEVPVSALLGAEGQGFKIAMSALDGGRIGAASQAAGIGLAALDAAAKYAHQRKAFGQPIAQFQAIQWMLADAATELETGRLLTLRAAWLHDHGRPYSQQAAMAKLYATEAAIRACDKAVQIHGGYGYTSEFPVARYFCDARVTAIYEGTSQVQKIVIARGLLKDGLAA